MTSGEIVISLFIAFVSAGLGSLFWTRLNRLESRLDGVMAQMATQGDMNRLEDGIDHMDGRFAQMVTRDEFREEMARLRGEVRAEIAGLRSDLTQVALAVGARGPQA